MMTLEEKITEAFERRRYFNKVFDTVEIVDQETADLVEVLASKALRESWKIEVLSFLKPGNRYFYQQSIN